MKSITSLLLLTVAAFSNMVSQVDSVSLPLGRAFKVHKPWLLSQRRHVTPVQRRTPELGGHNMKAFYQDLYRQLSSEQPPLPVYEPYNEPLEPSILSHGYGFFDTDNDDDDDDEEEDTSNEETQDEDESISPHTRTLIDRIMHGAMAKRHY